MATTKESGEGLLLEWERMENVPPTSGLGGGVRGRHARSFCVCADTNKAQNWAGNESTGSSPGEVVVGEGGFVEIVVFAEFVRACLTGCDLRLVAASGACWPLGCVVGGGIVVGARQDVRWKAREDEPDGLSGTVFAIG